MAYEVTRQVVEAVDIPVVVKLTPDQSRPVEIARAVQKAGAAAVTATNRHTGFAVDIEAAEPRLAGTAGIGGTWGQAADAQMGAQHLPPRSASRSPAPTGSSTTATRSSS